MKRHLLHRGLVPPARVNAALRLIWREWMAYGPTPTEAHEWSRTTAVPWARNEPEILRLLPTGWGQSSVMCEPQILVRWPEPPLPEGEELTGHVDEPPPWAEGREYELIIGVALTPADADTGCLHVWDDEGTVEPVPMSAGDVVTMLPEALHTGSPNVGPAPRVAVYFRTLQDELR